MKILALLFALSLYLLPNPTHSTRNPTADVALASDTTPVFDYLGKEIEAGEVYYIISNSEPVGEVALLQFGLGPAECPTNVIICSDDLDYGVIITPKDQDSPFVLESTLQNFKFNISLPPPCENSVSWVVQYESWGQYIVKTSDKVEYLFKIEAVQSLPGIYIYKIIYCVIDVCYNVSTYYDDKIAATRLALSSSFQPVVFKKAISSVVTV